MVEKIEFMVGETYENVKGAYKVVSMDSKNNSMVIRWESGEEIESSISLQQKIIQRLAAEKRVEPEEKPQKKKAGKRKPS